MKSRDLSCFLCREMIYEFATAALDSRRRASVERHLSSCKDCSVILDEHTRAIKHLEELAHAKISLKAVQDLKEKNRIVSRNVGWRRLPESLRWGLEALFLAILVAATFHFGSQWWAHYKDQKAKDAIAEIDTLPQEVDQSQYPEDTLAEADIEADEESGGIQEPEAPAPHSDEVGSESAAGPGLHHAGTDAIHTDQTPQEVSPQQDEASYVVPTTPMVLVLNPSKTVTLAGTKATPMASTAPTPATVAMNTAPSATVQDGGFVYRMAMSLKGIDSAVPGITEKIVNLGGQKAGQVQLGWKKPGGSYYHFTLPESNFDPLMTYLRSFAQVRHSKDPHKRVMPAGTIRIILWVEELEPPKPSERPQPVSSPEESVQEEPQVTAPETTVPSETTEEAPQVTE